MVYISTGASPGLPGSSSTLNSLSLQTAQGKGQPHLPCLEEFSSMTLLLIAFTPRFSRERRTSASRIPRYGRQGRKEGMSGSRPEGLCGCRCPCNPGCGHPGRPAGRPGRGHSVPAVLCLPRTRCLSPCLDHLLPGHLHHTDAVLRLLLHLRCIRCLNMQTGPSLCLERKTVPHASHHVGCHNCEVICVCKNAL